MKHLTKRSKGVTMLLASLIYIPYLLGNPADNFNNTSLILVILLWLLIFYVNRNSYNLVESLLNVMILSIPISFVSIKGSTESLIFVNWFIIFNSLLLMSLSVKLIQNIKLLKLNATTTLLCLSVVGLTISHFINMYRGVSSSTSTLVMLIMFLLSIVFGILYLQVTNISNKTLQRFTSTFGFVVFFLSITVLLQFVLYRKGIAIGRINHYSNGRVAFGSINYDFSFLSLLLVSNIFMIIQGVLNKRIKKLAAVVVVLIQFSASFLTSARTGPVAALIVIMVALMYYLIVQNVFKMSVIKRVVFTVVILLIEFVGFYFIYSKRGFGASERDLIYRESFDTILAHPFIGQGLGWISSFKINPHNFFLQTFVESGALFAVPLILGFITFFTKLFKANQFILLDICTIFIGSMFIPDILKSRFLLVIFLLGVISIGTKELTND